MRDKVGSPFDHAAAEEAGLLMGTRDLAGNSGDFRDTMIAGIAIAQRATLATRNIRHFDDLSVSVVDPWA
jgi:predicted nucleic acid-binding protein